MHIAGNKVRADKGPFFGVYKKKKYCCFYFTSPTVVGTPLRKMQYQSGIPRLQVAHSRLNPANLHKKNKDPCDKRTECYYHIH